MKNFQMLFCNSENQKRRKNMNYLDEDKKRREKANNFKTMYQTIGENIKTPEKLKDQNFGDWHYEDYRHDSNSNFKAVTLKNDKTKEIAIFNIGTDLHNGKDWKDDGKMLLGLPTRQMNEAYNYHQEIVKNNAGYKINSVGHSEGGSESQYVGLQDPNTDVYTYNAYGIGRIRGIKKLGSTGENIHNYRDPQDPVSKVGKNIGNEYIVPINDETKRKPSVFGYKEAHQINNMGDINNAIIPAEYKKRKNNLGYIDNIDNVLFTNEDIGAMDRFAFQTYEPFIDKQLREQMVMPRHEADYRVKLGTAGLSFVNGYTRSDGVKVNGYYKRG